MESQTVILRGPADSVNHNRVTPTYHDSVLELRDVNPPAASWSASGGAELAAGSAQGLAGGVQELGRERTLTHAGAVSLFG